MKLRQRQGIVSGALFAVMVVILVSLDERVRERFGALLASGTDVTPWGARALEFGGALVSAVRHQSIDGAPLMVFAAVGAVLLVAMLKT